MKSDSKNHKYNTRSGEKEKDEEHKKSSPSDEEEDDDEEEEEEFDLQEYRKMLAKMFPSKHMKEKTRKKKRVVEEETDEEETDEEELEKLLGGKGAKFNITFTLGGEKEGEEDSDEDSVEDEDSDYEEEDSDGEDEDSDEEEEAVSTETKKRKRDTTLNDRAAITKLRDMAAQLTEEEKNSSVVKTLIKQIEEEDQTLKKNESKRTKKERTKNTKQFKKLIREKNAMNDAKYFEKELTVEQQIEVLEKVAELKKHSDVSKPYRLTLLDADIPNEYKALAYNKINTLKYMDPGGGEYYKMKNWVDTFMKIPFGDYATMPLTIEDGPERCHEFMANAKDTLDQAVFGLNDAKLQIMQMMGQWIANPSAMGTAIAIKGPMGTGKTTLVKNGISKILNREFAFIALGGATDSSFLEGHSYTYEGSTWGKIVEILVQCKTMNPIIFFDELDKVSDTPKGEEIIGILTHLIDTTQNSKFHDKYFSELEFDLSRCLFIFSYNDESAVNPILRDRMYRIHTKGYEKKEKTTIANDYLMPAIQEQVRFAPEDITIPEETIHYLIEKHTDKEEGVRNLKRCLEVIHTKLNLYRLMKPGTNLFKEDMSLKVEFPITVTKNVIDNLFKQSNNEDNQSFMHMYM